MLWMSSKVALYEPKEMMLASNVIEEEIWCQMEEIEKVAIKEIGKMERECIMNKHAFPPNINTDKKYVLVSA